MRQRTTLVLMAAAGLLFSAGTLAFAEGDGPEKLTINDFELSGQIRVRGNVFDPDENAVEGLGEDSYVEQRTVLGVQANVNENLAGVVEVDVYSNWGDQFRSNPLTGEDDADSSSVGLYQGYIDWQMDGAALTVGRQELVFGSEWLLGNNSNGYDFYGLSYDALRLDLGQEDGLNAALFAAKMAEGHQNFYERDADLFGIYGNYGACEGQDFDVYALYYRDKGQYPMDGGDVNLYTVGLRVAADQLNDMALDYDLEGAYQWGEYETVGGMDIDYGTWAVNAEAGYTLDVEMAPRMYVLFAYLSGGDDDEMSFNRLMSDKRYFSWERNRALTNALVYGVGLTVDPDENSELGVSWTYLQVHEEVVEDTLGWEAAAWYGYDVYSNFNVNLGFAWFSADDGSPMEGVRSNGFAPIGLASDADAYYGWLEGVLTF